MSKQTFTATVKKSSAGQTTLVLSGFLNESSHSVLNRVLGEFGEATTVEVDSADVSHVNSQGAAAWTTFAKELTRSRRLVYVRTAIPMVEYFNMVPSMSGGGKIASFLAPFSCEKCRASSAILLNSEGLDPETCLDGRSCAKCGGSLDPDVAAEDYLVFISK